MMKKYLSLSCMVVGSLAVLSGCSKSEADNPTPAATGATVSGVVLAQDEVLRPLGKAGTTVQVEGLNKQVVTDEQGNYELKNIEPGRHVLNVSRAGMGTLRYELEVKSPAPVAFPTITLDQQSSTQVTSLTPVSRTSNSLPDEVAAFECQVAYNPQLYPAPKMYAVRLYVGKTSDVSNVRYLESSQISASESTPAPAVRGTAKLRLAFYASSLRSLGFASGEKVHLVAYGSAKDVQGGGIGREAFYFEPYVRNSVTGQIQRVEANLNANPVRADFTMP